MPWLLRIYRAAVLLVIAVIVHQQARWLDARRDPAISLRAAQRFFPAANRVQLRDPERGLYFVTDARGDTIGCLLTTSPQTDQIVGYSGPNDLLIALGPDGGIAGIEVLRSGDTGEHVLKVQRDARFFRSFVGWKPGEAPPPGVEGVSGATLTSLAMAEGIQQRLAGAAPSLRFPEPVTLGEVQGLFTNAVQVVQDRSRLKVLDRDGVLLGYATRTSPQADNVPGYRGPTECLVAIAPDGRTITAVRLRRSYDTDSYVDQIRRLKPFLDLFVGRTIDDLADLEVSRERMDGITGATMTARAAADGLKRHFKAAEGSRERAMPWRPQSRDWALLGVISGAMVMSFSELRGRRWVRLSWQVFLVGYVGLVNHDLLSLALLGGWAAHSPGFRLVPGLVLLVAAALLTPWTTRRQLYCHQICPHGAAQQLLGNLTRRRWTPSPGWTRILEMIPALLLVGALGGVLLGWRLNLAALEPFDAWAWRTAGAATISIAVAGLVASIFIPKAYCRFGCPTGALLGFIRSSGSADHWGRRDGFAAILLLAAMAGVMVTRAWPRMEPEPEPLTLSGRAMGTTWSVKIHDEVADPSTAERSIAGELEWAESMASHWRTNTDLSIFNRTPTTDAMPVPWPVLTLTRRSAEISRMTAGAFDITVGPLVRLWGFGPGPQRTEPPPEVEIETLRPSIGWEKLEVLDGMLRKAHPGLEVDLSGIAKGWAIDRVAEVLDRRGWTNYLIEVGGELRARGRWNIAIENPNRTCVLTNESIASSGTYRQNFRSGVREFSHLLDPRTLRPVTHRTVSVSVRHAECAPADAWATALNVLGIESGLPLAEELGLAAQFVVAQPDGKLKVQETTAWRSRNVPAGPSPGMSR